MKDEVFKRMSKFSFPPFPFPSPSSSLPIFLSLVFPSFLFLFLPSLLFLSPPFPFPYILFFLSFHSLPVPLGIEWSCQIEADGCLHVGCYLVYHSFSPWNAIHRHRSQLASAHPSPLTAGRVAGSPYLRTRSTNHLLLPLLLLKDRAEEQNTHRERRLRTREGETFCLWLQWDCKSTCPCCPSHPAFGGEKQDRGVQACA